MVKKVDGRWQAKGSVKRPNGKMGYWHSYFKTKREALAFEAEKRREISSSFSKMLTLNEIIEERIRMDSLNLKRSSISTNRYYSKYFVDEFGDMAVDKITSPMLTDWIIDLKGRGLSIRTINNARTTLNKFLNHAVKLGLIDTNPMAIVPAIRNTTSLKTFDNYWSQAEYDQFISHVTSRTDRFRYNLLWTTGMRIGEICAVQWKHYHDGYIEIVQDVYRGIIQTPKSANSIRKIAVPDRMIEELDAYKAEIEKRIGFSEDWYIIGDYKVCAPCVLSQHLKLDCERYTDHPITAHGFRHSHASILIEAGVPDIQIADRLGHSVEILHRTYAHMYDRQRTHLKEEINHIYK